MSIFHELYNTKLETGVSHEQAYSALLKNGCPPADALAIQVESKKSTGVIKFYDPVGPLNPEHSTWYTGPKEEDRFWPALRSRLEEKGWNENEVKNLDDA